MDRCVNATLLKSKGCERGNRVDARDFPALAPGDEQWEDGSIQRKRVFPMDRCTSDQTYAIILMDWEVTSVQIVVPRPSTAVALLSQVAYQANELLCYFEP